MSKLPLSLVAVLLIPALIIEPSWASLVAMPNIDHTAPSTAAVFTQAALVDPLISAWQRVADPTASTLRCLINFARGSAFKNSIKVQRFSEELSLLRVERSPGSDWWPAFTSLKARDSLPVALFAFGFLADRWTSQPSRIPAVQTENLMGLLLASVVFITTGVLISNMLDYQMHHRTERTWEGGRLTGRELIGRHLALGALALMGVFLGTVLVEQSMGGGFSMGSALQSYHLLAGTVLLAAVFAFIQFFSYWRTRLNDDEDAPKLEALRRYIRPASVALGFVLGNSFYVIRSEWHGLFPSDYSLREILLMGVLGSAIGRLISASYEIMISCVEDGTISGGRAFFISLIVSIGIRWRLWERLPSPAHGLDAYRGHGPVQVIVGLEIIALGFLFSAMGIHTLLNHFANETQRGKFVWMAGLLSMMFVAGGGIFTVLAFNGLFSGSWGKSIAATAVGLGIMFVLLLNRKRVSEKNAPASPGRFLSGLLLMALLLDTEGGWTPWHRRGAHLSPSPALQLAA
jgi:hypothetical protein